MKLIEFDPETRKIGLFGKIFFFEALLFSLTLILGILTGQRIPQIFQIQEVEIPKFSFWQFIFYFLLFTFFILFLSRILKQKRKIIVYKILFVLAISAGTIPLLFLWLPNFLSLIFFLILIFWWLKKPIVFNQDLLVILGIAGAGSILGLNLSPEMLIFLLIFFSFYDFIAVYKTKHMVEIAKEMIKSRAILALIVPSNILGFKENLEKIQAGRDFLFLGGGDVAFPLLFCVSLIPQGILKAFLVAFFATIGLFFSFLIFFIQKTHQPIPALPPIALFSILGYLVTRLI